MKTFPSHPQDHGKLLELEQHIPSQWSGTPLGATQDPSTGKNFVSHTHMVGAMTAVQNIDVQISEDPFNLVKFILIHTDILESKAICLTP